MLDVVDPDRPPRIYIPESVDPVFVVITYSLAASPLIILSVPVDRVSPEDDVIVSELLQYEI